VKAADAESAIEEAIKLYSITDPEQQKRLAETTAPIWRH